MTLREAGARLIAFFRKRVVDRELDNELAAHIELATDDYVLQGMPFEEARRRAMIELGGVEQSKEVHRESRGLPSLDALIQDVRHAFRGLWRSPAFALTAVAMLAIAIGVNAAVVMLTDTVLFKGFPLVERNDRVLYLSSERGCCVSYPDFEDWRAQAQSFQGMSIVHGIQKSFSDGSGFPETLNTTEISANTFKLAGQEPILGRDFLPSDEEPGAPRVTILRHDFWESRYGKDLAVLGRTVRINGEQTTIIGVMPPRFSFPQNADVWIPLVPTPEVRRRENRGQWFVFARLTDGATIEGARAEMETIGRRLGSAYPLTNQGRNRIPHVQRFHEFFIGPNASTIYQAMLGAVAFVLLIACANLGNLLLARSISRSREIRVRIALGAGRWRIIRQLLVESVIISGLGGFVGWWVAALGVRVFALTANGPSLSDNIGGNWFDNALDYSMDIRIFVYLFAISIGTGLLFGLAPASRLWKFSLNATLKDGGRGATGGARGKRLSAALVVAEMALAIVLLAGAGVMIRSFLKIYSADLGFKPEQIITALFQLPADRYPDPHAQRAFYDRLTQRLEAMPGVESAAIATAGPTSRGSGPIPYEVDDAAPPETSDDRRSPTVTRSIVGPGYFKTLGAGVLNGREFNNLDGLSGSPVVLVNARFARLSWPGQDPVGKRLRLFNGKKPDAWRTVIGVVPDIVRKDRTRQELESAVYLPYREKPSAAMWVLARTRVPPASLADAFRREVQAIDANLPTSLGPFSLAASLAETYRYRATTGVLFLIFAAIALLLASIGLYAVIAHSVTQRTQEIGVRLALGGTAGSIRRLVLRQGMLPMLIGLAIGIPASMGLNRFLKAQLVQVSPADPLTLAAASIVLIGAAMLGCLIPARRATRVDPMVALRHD